MKSVILGNDFLKDTDGSFKFLETNTSCGFPLKNIETYLNKTIFDSFLSDNGITKIDLINPLTGIIVTGDVDGFDSSLASTLHSFLTKNYSETHQIQLWSSENNVIPTIVDEEDRLIIRVSYDSNALVDDTYCRDNFQFLKLMHENDSNSIPKTYFTDGEDLSVDTIGTTIVDNGNYPNFLIKDRYPTINYGLTPKLIKVTTQEELQLLKTNLGSREILQEYIANTNDLLVNRFQTYRHYMFLYGNDLTELDLFEPISLTNKCEITTDIDYTLSNEVQKWERPKLLQKTSKQFSDLTPHSFDGERVFMADGTISTVDDLSILDSLKSIDLHGLDNEESSYVKWSVPKDDVLSTRISHYSVNVTEVGEPHDVNLSQKLELIDGTTYTLTFDAWSDRHRLILAGIGLSDDPWNNTSESVAITPTRSTYTLTLIATDFGEDGVLCRVLFDSGDTLGEVNIDSVVLKIGEGDNLLLNGDFELGSENWIVGVDDESSAPVVIVGSTITTAILVGKTDTADSEFFTKVTFTDGKVYKDLQKSVILTIVDGNSKFEFIKNLKPNDEVVIGNTTDNTLTTSIVSGVEYYFDVFNGVNIDVEEEDVFLRPLVSDDNYFIIKHNAASSCHCYSATNNPGNCYCNNPCVYDMSECGYDYYHIDCCSSQPSCFGGDYSYIMSTCSGGAGGKQ